MAPLHILSASQFTRAEIDAIFMSADIIKRDARTSRQGRMRDDLRGYIVGIQFHQPSTRTIASFEIATKNLAGEVFVEAAAKVNSSIAKKESLRDTVLVLGAMGIDALVIRHPEQSALVDAASVSRIPIINAGAGADTGEHPTQALLDLYTILRLSGETREINLTMCGDLKHSRTVRSLCRLVVQYYHGEPCPFRFMFVSPQELRIREDIIKELNLAGIRYEETSVLDDVLPHTNVFYQTRVQREYFEDDKVGRSAQEEMQSRFRIDLAAMRRLRKNAILLHPLPRVGEIAEEVDADPRAHFLTTQIQNGLHIRMALLRRILRPDLHIDSQP